MLGYLYVFIEGAAMTDGVDLTRKFVSESELEEKRKKRQEEWEKVRKPDDPEGKSLRYLNKKVQQPEIQHL